MTVAKRTAARTRAAEDVDARAINAEHEKGEKAQRTSLEHYRRCGELLARKKASLKHGEWGTWLKANITFAERTARRYMTFAELAESATVADLPDLWEEAKRGKPAKDDPDPADDDKDDDPEPTDDDPDPDPAPPPGIKYTLRAAVVVTPDTDPNELEALIRAGLVHWVLRNSRDKTLGSVRVEVVEALERLPEKGGCP